MNMLLMFVLLTTFNAPSARIAEALGQIESGNNDHAKGAAGEVSRYQIKLVVWRKYSVLSNWTNQPAAWEVAEAILRDRTRTFERLFKRKPTTFELYVLWNAPAQLTEGRVSPVVAERARRFENLMNAIPQKCEATNGLANAER